MQYFNFDTKKNFDLSGGRPRTRDLLDGDRLSFFLIFWGVCGGKEQRKYD
jgi:hypothetical protein